MASSSNTKDGVLQQRNKPVGKPRGMRRDRDCRSCKLRDVKCDLNRPSCGEVGMPSSLIQPLLSYCYAPCCLALHDIPSINTSINAHHVCVTVYRCRRAVWRLSAASHLGRRQLVGQRYLALVHVPVHHHAPSSGQIAVDAVAIQRLGSHPGSPGGFLAVAA